MLFRSHDHAGPSIVNIDGRALILLARDLDRPAGVERRPLIEELVCSLNCVQKDDVGPERAQTNNVGIYVPA